MSFISEIPKDYEIPADYKIPPNFNHLPLFDRLCLGEGSEKYNDDELRAVRLGINALIFLISPQPPPGSDYAALQDTPAHISVFTWPNRRQALLDYLGPYLTEMRDHGAPAQKQFIRELLDEKLHDYVKSKSVINDDAPTMGIEDTAELGEDEPEDETFPAPAEAMTILEGIVNKRLLTSAEYVALQITIRGFRYLIETGEGPEFMRYVDQMSK